MVSPITEHQLIAKTSTTMRKCAEYKEKTKHEDRHMDKLPELISGEIQHA